MSIDRTTPALRAAAYVRVSTDRQAKEGLSIDEYERRALAYIEAQGFELVELYREEGVSGRKAARPELDRLLDALDTFDVLVISSLDRFGRSVRNLSNLYEQLEAADVMLVSLKENIDSATASGRLMRNVLSSMAEFESDTIGERVASVSTARARTGKPPGGRFTLYGYDRIDKALVPNAAEAAVVLRMFEQAAAGRSAKKITRSLNADGIRTKAGKEWWHGSVSRTLRHPAYIGKVRLKGEVYEGEHEPIVPLDLWQKVEAMRASKRRARKGRSNSRGMHLFQRGFLRCGHCAGAMGARTYRKTGSDELREQYICLRRDSHGRKACPQTPVPREPIDSAVLEYFNDVGLDIDASKRHFAESIKQELAEVRALLAEAERAETAAAARLARVKRDYQDDEITAQEWREHRKDLEPEHVAAAANVERLRQREAELADGRILEDAEQGTLERLEALRQAIAGEISSAEDIAAVRGILERLFEQFVIGRYYSGDRSELPAQERELAEQFAAKHLAEFAEDIAADPDILNVGEYVVVPFERPEMIEDIGVDYRPLLRREAVPLVTRSV